MVFLKEFFEKADFEKNRQTTKKDENFPGGRVNTDASSEGSGEAAQMHSLFQVFPASIHFETVLLSTLWLINKKNDFNCTFLYKALCSKEPCHCGG